MISPKIFGVLLIVAVASIMSVTTISAAMASQPCCPSDDEADVEAAETAEAGNATTTMMTNQTADGNMTDVKFLAIQTAQSGSIFQINETAYALELNNVANDTIQFSDRPNRIVETVSTSDFVGNWSVGQNSFSSDEPNDALIVENKQTGQLETAVIESFSPVYDMTTNRLTYTIMAENWTSMNMPSEFRQSVLVIDSNEKSAIFTTFDQDYNNCC